MVFPLWSVSRLGTGRLGSDSIDFPAVLSNAAADGKRRRMVGATGIGNAGLADSKDALYVRGAA
jgi:hypothetical protein